jgi:hypothetical protein
MTKLFVFLALALFGDPGHLSRFWIALGLGACSVVLGYWLVLPQVLPLWPALLTLGIAAVVGIAWEIHASNNSSDLR